MNNDLISRKYVIAELLKEREQFPPMVAERYSFGVKTPHSFNQAMRGGIRKGLRIVETAPAVDAEPVVHSMWLEHIAAQNTKYWACLRCDTMGSPRWKRCPMCESKMDMEVAVNENP